MHSVAQFNVWHMVTLVNGVQSEQLAGGLDERRQVSQSQVESMMQASKKPQQFEPRQVSHWGLFVVRVVSQIAVQSDMHRFVSQSVAEV
jgi:hypothetical protein